MWTILFYSILLTNLSESQQVLSRYSGLKVNTSADTTGLDWPWEWQASHLPTYPAEVPTRSPPLSWGPGCCGSHCSGSPAATFKGAISMDPGLSSAASSHPQMPRLAQCAGTACSWVHCLGPMWTSPCLHTRFAKYHASACVHVPMSHWISPTKLRLKDRKHLDGAGRPGVLQFMGSQSRTLLSDWTELNWLIHCWFLLLLLLLSRFSRVRLRATP